MEEFGFEAVGIDLHFAGGDLRVGCALKAELAHAETFFILIITS
jgi:hypothetical protein